MAETYIQANADGSGKKLHSFDRTVGANSVHDEIMLHGEPEAATYNVTTVSTSIATANAHPLQIMAGAALIVYVRRLVVYQSVAVTTAAIATWELWRLSTAGTGGTAVTPAPLDTTDGAAGATAMTLPTVKGTESTKLWSGTAQLTQTVATQSNGREGTVLLDLPLDWLLRSKAIRIPAGTTNGLALKWVSASAGASVIAVATISERSY